jgi:methylmalonyl-CoA mutase
MTAPSEHLELAAEFPSATRDQWRDLVAGVLAKSGGAADQDPELALSKSTYDGIEVHPLYTAADAPYPLDALGSPGHAPFVRGTRSDTAGGWDVRQRHADSDVERVNRAILTDLENGVTSLWLGIGPSAIGVDDLPRALDGVYLDLAPIVLDAGAETAAATEAFFALLEKNSIAAEVVAGSLGSDPIALAARTGGSADIESIVALARQSLPYARLHAITVDGTVYNDAGGSDADELASATSAGVTYLRALTEAGFSVDDALDQIEFRFSVSDNQFDSIAKLRAARRIWNRVGELSGAGESHRGQRQHAVSSAAMMTQRDPWVNMLRTTIACFSAAVGGAEAITVAPFDAALAPSDDFSRRIARNTQSVLHDESSLARVVDPAGGSWYVESLTDQLAQAAWAKFTALEADGGAVNLDAVAALIKPAREQRADDIAHRRFPITAVSEFANLTERTPARVVGVAPTGGLPVARYAADFEALRDEADAQAVRPTVFLAALGPVSAHSGRLGFASNLFQVGGLAVVEQVGDVDSLSAAFKASGAVVACLCSSDKIYADSAAPAAAALKAAGARTVWLAGQGGQRAESDAAAGVDGSVFVGCDALSVLRRTLEESTEVPA